MGNLSDKVANVKDVLKREPGIIMNGLVSLSCAILTGWGIYNFEMKSLLSTTVALFPLPGMVGFGLGSIMMYREEKENMEYEKFRKRVDALGDTHYSASIYPEHFE